MCGPIPALDEMPARGRALVQKGLPRGGLTGHHDGEHIEPVFFATHPVEQRGNLIIVGVVDAHGNSRATFRGDHFGRLLDGLGPSGVDVR
jgi:hypothetical protein